MSITVIGLGPGDATGLTRAAWEILATTPLLLLRTARHPAVADLPEQLEISSYDEVYEEADTFADVYRTIVDDLLRRAKEGDVVYAVPGHPHVGESTVLALESAAAAADVTVHVVPGISFVEPVLTAVGEDGLDGLQLYDALAVLDGHYPPLDGDRPVLLGQVYSRFVASELKLTLSAVYPDEHPVALVHRAGLPDQHVERIPLYAIDRSEHVEHLTSLYIPPLPAVASLPRFAETIATLRSPEGCPWDREQTPQSMRQGLLEEVAELLDALDRDDVENVREELGDVLMHVVFQAQMAHEVGDFTLSDVIAGIDAKLKHRHPHVWGDLDLANAEEVLRNWEDLKAAEKTARGVADAPQSLLDNVPEALPALARSQKIQKRVARVGFDWPALDGVYAKMGEELAEVQAASTAEARRAEVGDLLFAAVNVARWHDVDAESALREANLRFSRRFRLVEAMAREQGIDIAEADLDTLEALWQGAKARLSSTEESS